MNWELELTPEAEHDLDSLEQSQRKKVDTAIRKVRTNPLPQSEGGYGKPLGNKRGINLAGLLKVKLKRDGIRIVYRLVKTETKMIVIVIGIREGEEVYETTAKGSEGSLVLKSKLSTEEIEKNFEGINIGDELIAALSESFLKSTDKTMENFKNGIVSEPVDLTEL